MFFFDKVKKEPLKELNITILSLFSSKTILYFDHLMFNCIKPYKPSEYFIQMVYKTNYEVSSIIVK